ncbi:MAG: hypothetical protein IPF66_07450 [Holophagales bacterium]|nr:hypothetical protein [Holophagales bacterium]
MSSGVAGRSLAQASASGSRTVWLISQFWQNGHLKSHPSIPKESALAPGRT